MGFKVNIGNLYFLGLLTPTISKFTYLIIDFDSALPLSLNMSIDWYSIILLKLALFYIIITYF